MSQVAPIPKSQPAKVGAAASPDLHLIELQNADAWAPVFVVAGVRYFQITPRFYAWLRGRVAAVTKGAVPFSDAEKQSREDLLQGFERVKKWSAANLDKKEVAAAISANPKSPATEDEMADASDWWDWYFKKPTNYLLTTVTSNTPTHHDEFAPR